MSNTSIQPNGDQIINEVDALKFIGIKKSPVPNRGYQNFKFWSSKKFAILFNIEKQIWTISKIQNEPGEVHSVLFQGKIISVMFLHQLLFAVGITFKT